MSEPEPCITCGRVHQPGPCPKESSDRKILTRDEVIEHVKQGEAGGHVHWVEMKELLEDNSEACVDGRGEMGVIGTPGGNAGELALYLDSYEKISGKKLNEEEVRAIFDNYLAAFGKFYLHTDGQAVHHLGVQDEQELSNPPEDKKNELLEKLTNPNNIGCGHLKHAMIDPEAYKLNPDLIKFLMKAFFKRLWAGDSNVEFVILEGEHKEGAVITVKVAVEEINEQTKIPTISPKIEGASAFVYHPQAVKFMRRQSAEQVNAVIGAVTGAEVDEDKFAEFILASGDHVLGETVSRLARDQEGGKLPFFEITFGEDGKIKEVEEI